jgi:hypothetical protein
MRILSLFGYFLMMVLAVIVANIISVIGVTKLIERANRSTEE